MSNKKIIFLLATIAIVISTLTVCVFADEAPTLAISRNSLELKNAVFMNFKVSSENIEDISAIELLVWNEPQTEYAKGTEISSLPSIRTEEDTGYHVFQYNDISAKEMTDTIYVCAYANINEQDIYSKPVKFSIFQYAYNNLNSSSASEELKSLLTYMLEYGASAQIYFDYNTDFLATDEIAKIKVVNGKHSDGFSTGYFKAGTEITITANEPDEGYIFNGWKDAGGNIVSTDSVFVIPECETNTYTAEYSETGSTGDDSSDDESPDENTEGLVYRYREKEYTSSTTELSEPWVLESTKTEYKHGNYQTIRIRASVSGSETSSGYTSSQADSWRLSNSSKYCFHTGKSLVSEYMRKTGYNTGAEYIYTSNSQSIDYTKYTNTGCKYWEFEYCTTKTPYNIYYYYKWGEWSEWSDTPVTATEDREVETKQVAHEHDYSVIVTAPTCTSEGYSTYTCTGCEDSYIDEYTNSTGHSFGDWQIITEQTCNADGEKYRQCTACDAEETVELVALGHSYIDEVVEPTCTEQGYTEHTCENCGDSYIDNYVDSLGHNYENNVCTYCGDQNKTIVDTGTCGEDLTWTLYEEGLLSIEGTGKMYNYSEYNTSNGSRSPWYQYRDSINNVIIDNNVTSIGNYAFWLHKNIESISIGDSVETIGEKAFYSCENIKNIYLPDSVTQISSYSFCGCINLKSIHLGSSLESLGTGSLGGCTSLETISFPNSLKLISTNACSGCTGLTSVIIPSSITDIGSGAFYDCTSILNVYITDIEKWCDIAFSDSTANPLMYANELYLNNQLITTKLSIPNNVESIGDYAFSGYEGITEVVIPSSVTHIGAFAFQNCDNLTSVTISGEVNSIGNGVFFGCENLSKVLLDEGIKLLGNSMFEYCDSLISIIIPNSVTSIGSRAFYDCSNLTDITIPGSVTSIGDYAFDYCNSLTTMRGVSGSIAEIWANNMGIEFVSVGSV